MQLPIVLSELLDQFIEVIISMGMIRDIVLWKLLTL